MKFSVALLSNRAVVSALLVSECIKQCIVIDFHIEIYTLSLLLCLIRADLIRHWENPRYLHPSLWLVSVYPNLIVHSSSLGLVLLDLFVDRHSYPLRSNR
jgi:hypothetical protein